MDQSLEHLKQRVEQIEKDKKVLMEDKTAMVEYLKGQRLLLRLPEPTLSRVPEQEQNTITTILEDTHCRIDLFEIPKYYDDNEDIFNILEGIERLATVHGETIAAIYKLLSAAEHYCIQVNRHTCHECDFTNACEIMDHIDNLLLSLLKAEFADMMMTGSSFDVDHFDYQVQLSLDHIQDAAFQHDTKLKNQLFSSGVDDHEYFSESRNFVGKWEERREAEDMALMRLTVARFPTELVDMVKHDIYRGDVDEGSEDAMVT